MKPIVIIAIAIVFGIGIGLSINVSAEESLIPSWIKSTAGFWVDGQIGDSEFLSALQYLVKEGLLVIPSETSNDPILIPKEKLDETSILGGIDVAKKYEEFTDLQNSLTEEEIFNLTLMNVAQSEFAYVIAYDGKFSVTHELSGMKLEEFENALFVPFDCSHEKEWLDVIVATKIDESGKLQILGFKNKMWVSYAETIKPFGMAIGNIPCDFTSYLSGIDEQGDPIRHWKSGYYQ
jgi:hypothetical protein